MTTKLTLTPEAQGKVDAMLAAEPILTAGPGPVLPLGRNAGLTQLVDEANARTVGVKAQAVAKANRVKAALGLRLASIRRYGLLGALIKVLYWGVSWHELAFRTARKYYLKRPAYWPTDSKEVS